VIAGSTRAEDGLFLGMASYLPLLVEGKPLSLALREVQYTQGFSPISLFVVILDDVGIYGLIRKGTASASNYGGIVSCNSYIYNGMLPL
jgi:hypothetical protein